MESSVCRSDAPEVMFGSSDGLSGSEEHWMLTELCQSLVSSCSCRNESPNAMDETRQEAKLLMNLLLSNVTSIEQEDVVSSSDPSCDRSLTSSSESSVGTTAKRDLFTFTCPSLSLEHPSFFLNAEKLDALAHEAASELRSESPLSPLPAHWLHRPLKVDDRDALRLSADAMARNVLQSFQKAMDWRIAAWIQVLSQQLVAYERDMRLDGATVADTKVLLQTPEATLLVALQRLLQERGVATESATTSFDVLPQRVPLDGPPSTASVEAPHEDEVATATACSISSVSSSKSSDSPPDGTYSYIVAHQLRFSCAVSLQTPAGPTEIVVAVPGTITGSFGSVDLSAASELESVTLDLDTNILASMIEKAGRTIVRSSMETILAEASSAQEEEAHGVVEKAPQEEEKVSPVNVPEREFALSSPPGHGIVHRDSIFVTPRCVSEETLSQKKKNTPSQVLLPMPDDLDRQTDLPPPPRRISPQPMSSSSRTFSENLSFSRLPSEASSTLKRRTPPPMSLDDDDALVTTTNVHHRWVYSDNFKRRLPLISPPAGYQEFHEVPENGPSLPLLVEVACRAMGVADDES